MKKQRRGLEETDRYYGGFTRIKRHIKRRSLACNVMEDTHWIAINIFITRLYNC